MAGNAYLKAEFGITRGFGHLDFRTTTDGTAVVEDFAHWLAGAGDGPWAAYLHLMDVHSPLPQELFPTRPMVDRGVEDLADTAADTLLGYYAAGVRRADDHVGAVLDLLDDAGRRDDTWVILTADHGEELNEHGMMLSHGQSLYRQLVWVPLIVRLPGGERAGSVAAGPVSHIDLLPTLLEAAGAPVPPGPGHSLAPVLHGGEPSTASNGNGVAFSELVKRVRYSRSVTTAEHHYIETFHISKTPPATLADLCPGVGVEVKGQALRAGEFLPTKVTVGIPGADKLLGLVEQVDVDGGTLTVLGQTVQVDAGTELIGLDKGPFALADLTAGERINVTLDPGGDGSRRARAVMWRKAGGESKLEGPVEAIEGDGEDGTLAIRVLGWWVRVDPAQLRLVHREDSSRKLRRQDVLAMVAAGDWVARDRELYRYPSDPAEAVNLADEEVEVVEALERRLAGWAESIAGFQAPGELVELDPETVEQLRKLGYLA